MSQLSLGAVIIGALIAGCSEPSTTVAPPESPTPAPSPSLPAAAPEVLPFECSEVMDPAAFERITRTSLPESNEPGGAFFEMLTRQIGHGTCSWYRSDPYANVRIFAEIAGPGAVSAESGGCADTSGTSGWVDCSRTTVLNGYRVSTYLGGAFTMTIAEAEAAEHELFAPAFAALAAEPAPAAWTVPDGAWAPIVDCLAVDAQAEVSVATGVPAMTVADVTGEGEDGTVPRVESAAWGLTVCRWRADDPDTAAVPWVDVEFVAGGGWLWRDLIPSAAPGTIEPVEVAGADVAAFECTDDEACALLLGFGVNSVRISGTRDLSYQGLALTREQLAALADTLAPVIRTLV